MLKTVEDTVLAEIRTLLVEVGGKPAVTLADRLNEVGFDSLRLARLMITLETEFGVDPFTAEGDRAVEIFDVHTVGEMVDAYVTAVGAMTIRSA